MENQLQGKDNLSKSIILQIISAHGFGLVKGFIVIHATLVDQKLQTPSIPISKNELKFKSESIIWLRDDADFRKLKMSDACIRVECFHKPSDNFSSDERLGYILLKLRGAQTINPTSHERVEYKSYKLLGTKNCSYNLTLSLRIEDMNVRTIETSPKTNKNLKSINNKNINDNKNYVEKVEENEQFKENAEVYSPECDVNMLEQTEHFLDNNKPQNLVDGDDVRQKIIEELEDWKDKQMILFYEQMKVKEEQLLKEFNKKWLEDRKNIEEELIAEVSKCKTLAENMDKMADMLKERETIITTKELELASQKNSANDKYINFIQNMQFSNSQTINEFSNKITELETKLYDSEKNNILLSKENEQLKDDINTKCLRIQQIENTISILENKCEEANKSSMYYKERWITSVRKINQMYNKFYGSKVNEHLLSNRQNIQNILTNQFVERQHDEEKLRKLLDDLAKLRQDMSNTNYMSL